MGSSGVDRKDTSFPRAGVRKLESLCEDLSASASPGSLQVERLELEAGEEEEEAGGELEDRLDACEETEEEEEVLVESRALGSSREDGMQSHVSRSENLEQLSISRTLSSPTPGMSSFSSAVWKRQDVLESRDDSKTQEFSESTDIFSHIVSGAPSAAPTAAPLPLLLLFLRLFLLLLGFPDPDPDHLLRPGSLLETCLCPASSQTS